MLIKSLQTTGIPLTNSNMCWDKNPLGFENAPIGAFFCFLLLFDALCQVERSPARRTGSQDQIEIYALKNNQLARRYERDARTNGSTYVRLSAVETNLWLRLL